MEVPEEPPAPRWHMNIAGGVLILIFAFCIFGVGGAVFLLGSTTKAALGGAATMGVGVVVAIIGGYVWRGHKY